VDVLTSMSIFCRVVEAGSFSAIANEMNSSQPTISKHVAALEQRLGTKLLNRSTRQLSLTEEGEQYYQHSLRILADVAESEASVGQGKTQPTGTLRITTPVMFGRLFIAPILWEFFSTYTDVSIELMVDDQNIDLIKEGIDVAIRAGKLSDSSLVARKIGVCPKQVLVASPAYLQKYGEPETPDDLQHHNCLLHSLAAPAGGWELIGPNGTESVMVNSRFTSNNRDILNAASLAHLGLAITFLWPNEEHIKQGRLKVVLPDYQIPDMEIYAIYPERRYIPQKVKIFIDYLCSRFNSAHEIQKIISNATV